MNSIENETEIKNFFLKLELFGVTTSYTVSVFNFYKKIFHVFLLQIPPQQHSKTKQQKKKKEIRIKKCININYLIEAIQADDDVETTEFVDVTNLYSHESSAFPDAIIKATMNPYKARASEKIWQINIPTKSFGC